MTTTDWTDARVERLKALWLEGVSAEAIARTLGGGATRSAVLGKLHRLGVRRAAAARPAGSARAAPCAWRARAASAAPLLTPTPCLRAQATLMTVGPGDCRWPCGDPGAGDLPVCGRAVSRGAYCACHGALSYRGPGVSLFALAGLKED